LNASPRGTSRAGPGSCRLVRDTFLASNGIVISSAYVALKPETITTMARAAATYRILTRLPACASLQSQPETLKIERKQTEIDALSE
jgi:hypothetical protein